MTLESRGFRFIFVHRQIQNFGFYFKYTVFCLDIQLNRNIVHMHDALVILFLITLTGPSDFRELREREWKRRWKPKYPIRLIYYAKLNTESQPSVSSRPAYANRHSKFYSSNLYQTSRVLFFDMLNFIVHCVSMWTEEWILWVLSVYYLLKMCVGASVCVCVCFIRLRCWFNCNW